MKQTIVIVILSFLTHFVLGQINRTDTLKVIRNKLIAEIEKIKSDCTDFEIHKTPKWADSNLYTKTYNKNCRSSGTYIVLSSDSTFLYKHNGEGTANFLQKGYWKIENDSILILKSSYKLSNDFSLKIKQFETTDFKIHKSLLRKYIMKDKVLLDYHQ